MRTLLLALLAVAPVSAQQPASDAIPRELALALISGFRGGRAAPTIIVGRVPTAFPTLTLPANANVLGGTEHSDATSLVLTIPGTPDSARSSLVRQLEQSGWRLAQRDWGQGFVPSASDLPVLLCRGDAGLNLVVRERSQGGSLAVVTSWRARERGPCDEDDRRGRMDFDRPELPTLEAPPAARSFGQGMGGGREGREAFTRIESSMTSADLAAHYARQLTTAGWTLSGPSVGNGIVVYGVRHRDGENRPVGGVLLVFDIPESRQREVLLRIAREERRP